MTMHQKINPEAFNAQKLLLFSKLGEPGSGYARYSAAMYFHKQDLLSPELLEIYRRCCKLDNEDPLALAAHEGIDGMNEMLQPDLELRRFREQ